MTQIFRWNLPGMPRRSRATCTPSDRAMGARRTPTDRRTVRSAAVWSLAITLGVGGCSGGSEALAGAPAGQPSRNPSAPTSTVPSSPSPTATAPAFKQDPVDSAFAKKLEALCNDWNNFASSHQYPGAANPQAATVEELPKIAAWMDSLPINHELVARAAGLGTPAAGTTAWARVLDDFARYEKSVATAAAAAKAGNLQAWKTTEESWAAARDTVREDLLKAGIGNQSTCSLPFIRPASHGN
jgi:hypothetical protein